MGDAVEYLVLARRDATRKGHDVVEQCKRIERRVFPKHESMCETFDKEISKSNTQLAYAAIANEVVGYIVFVRDGDVGKVIKLCVSPSHRRLGIGAALLDRCLQCLGVPPQAAGDWAVHAQDGVRAEAGGDAGAAVSREAEADKCVGAGSCMGQGKQSKGRKKTLGCLGMPEANAPGVVQLQVDPAREGAFRLYKSRGFEQVRGGICRSRLVSVLCGPGLNGATWSAHNLLPLPITGYTSLLAGLRVRSSANDDY